MLNDIQLLSTFLVVFHRFGTCRSAEFVKTPHHNPNNQLCFLFFVYLLKKALYSLTSAPFVSLYGGTMTITGRVRKTVKSASQLCYVCMSFCLSSFLSIPLEQLGFHWTDFNEI